jgi:poly(A) polymerase
VVNGAGATVLTFGSFRLGVFGPGSDIDTLVVGPKNVHRADFFEHFPDLLLKHTPEGAITGLTPVTGAFVPVLKFEYYGISIDLTYSRIDVLSVIPDNLSLLDPNLLRGLDTKDIATLNGNRVTDEILELVPQPAIFKTALRAVKLWAQRRAIYANIVGFCGGVAWAMLLARVCQLYPKATSSTMVLKFFRIIEGWHWPVPVQLKPFDAVDLNLQVWNPKVSPLTPHHNSSANLSKLYYRDSLHLMPILTPAYPSMCSTYNVTQSTLAIMTKELKRGGLITEKIMTGKASWKDLFAKHTFFTKDYKYYLAVTSASTTKEAQKIWSGRVESRVRILVGLLEVHESIALAHPFNKTFERIHRCRTDEEIEKAKGGNLDYLFKETPTEATNPKSDPDGGVPIVKEEGVNGEKNSTNGDESFTFVYTTTSYVGLELKEGEYP